MEECQQREAELINKLQKTPKLKKKILIEQKGDKKRKREPDESDDEAPKKDKGEWEINLSGFYLFIYLFFLILQKATKSFWNGLTGITRNQESTHNEIGLTRMIDRNLYQVN